MHKNVLPLLFGFILLGALGHGAAQRVRGQDADAPAPESPRRAGAVRPYTIHAPGCR